MKKFENYVSHLRVLKQAGGENLENEFIISGIIDKFSLQFELGWKTLKELLAYNVLMREAGLQQPVRPGKLSKRPTQSILFLTGTPG